MPTTSISVFNPLAFLNRTRISIAANRTVWSSGTRDDQVVAMVEIVSRGNKSTRQAIDQFVRKAARFLDQGIHLLIVDIQSPGRHDPQGIHGTIWDYIAGKDDTAPANKPLTVVAYEYDLVCRAYVEPLAVGDPLPDMPLFLRPGRWVKLPLEAMYQATWRVFPQRWKDVIDPGA
jgi:hypothetical protein